MQDPEIAAIDAAMVAQKRSRADLGRLLGLDSSQVSRIFSGKRRLQHHEHTKVTEWLGLSAPPPQVVGGRVVPLPGMVPLYGWTGPSAGQLSLSDEGLRGYVPMHPAQMHVKDAFALEVSDITMSPRYEPGEIVYVAPNRWPSRGQDCLVLTASEVGLLRRFNRRDGEAVHILQLNPEREQTLPLGEVEAVHAIVGRG